MRTDQPRDEFVRVYSLTGRPVDIVGVEVDRRCGVTVERTRADEVRVKIDALSERPGAAVVTIHCRDSGRTYSPRIEISLP